MKREDLTLGLIGLIALLTIVNTVLILTKDDKPTFASPTASSPPNAAATNNQAKTPAVTGPNNQEISTTIDNTNAASPVNNNMQADKPMAQIKFNEYEHDFGTVKAETPNRYTFKFVNTGDNPLIIENARSTCGCTVPEWPKEPIPPNGTGEILVEYKPKAAVAGQRDQKQVTVTANTPERNTVLKIAANVTE